MDLSTRNIIIGVFVAIVGAVSLALPGGYDWLSGINLFMGGLVLGLGLAFRWLR